MLMYLLLRLSLIVNIPGSDNRPVGTALVFFFDAASASAAIREFNNMSLDDGKGGQTTLDVTFALDKGDKRPVRVGGGRFGGAPPPPPGRYGGGEPRFDTRRDDRRDDRRDGRKDERKRSRSPKREERR